jgi:hypothetical protein
MITLLGFVLGPNVAFKLVSVSGLLALPLVANRLAVRAGAPRLDAGLFALGAFAFLVDPHFAILGGNILSTMAGEFSFSISLALAVTFLGVLVRFLRTGRGAPLLPCLLAATAVSHLLPMVFASVSALIIVAVHLIGRRADDAPERRGTLVALVACAALAAALMGFWLLPFAANLNYTTDMGWAPASSRRCSTRCRAVPRWPVVWWCSVSSAACTSSCGSCTRSPGDAPPTPAPVSAPRCCSWPGRRRWRSASCRPIASSTSGRCRSGS